MAQAIRTSNEIPTCHGGLENLDDEHSYWIENWDGDIPKDLTGTFFRNGPGRQRIGDTTYGHWFDGDGMLAAFTFQDGRVHFRNRYVRTPKYVEETESQSILYRGFGTQIPGGIRKNLFKMPANPANTSTIYHGGHLLALNEGGKPWKLAPSNLETVGEFTYDGALQKADVFSAHGKVHTRTGDYINYGAGISGIGLKGLKPCLSMYRIGKSGEFANRVQVPLDRFPFCHDFALTDKYAVFFVGSIVFGNMMPMVVGTKTISDLVSFDENLAMQILVVDLDTFDIVRTFETGPGAVIHFGNAYEEGDEIVVDGMFAGDFDANTTLTDVFNPDSRFNGGTYQRYRLNLNTGTIASEKVTEVESEFPTFNPAYGGRKNEVTYTACSVPNSADSFFNAIAKVSDKGGHQLLELPKGTYGSEPLFAASDNSSAEDDGYVLEVVYDGFKHLSELQILRAADMSHQCTLYLTHHLPHQFHGFFTPNTFLRD